MSRTLKNARVEEALQGGTHGGTLVIADTKQQVLNKACKGEIGLHVIFHLLNSVLT